MSRVRLAALASGLLLLAAELPAVATGLEGTSSESGVCDELGCTAGETKCAEGVVISGGLAVEFTCYTTILPD